MKVFRSPYVCVAVLLSFVSEGVVPVFAAPEQPADITNPAVPLMNPITLMTSCTDMDKKKTGASTGNAQLDAMAGLGKQIFGKEKDSGDSLDEFLYDKAKCDLIAGRNLPEKMDLSFNCESSFRDAGLPKALSDDPEVACKVSKQFDRMRAANYSALCLSTCQQKKVDALIAEKSCLDQIENNLREQMKQYSNQLGEYIKQVEGKLSDVDGELKERQTIRNEIAKVLGGDEKLGKPGLMQARNRLKELQQGLPALAKGIKQAAEGLKKSQESFGNYRKQVALNRAVSCFKSEPSRTQGFTCDGAQVSAERYVECLLNKKYVGKNKTKNASILNQKKAAFAKILQDMEAVAVLPPPPKPGEAPQPVTFTTLEEIKSRFANRLSALGSEVGLDLGRLVSEQINQCYLAKHAEVDRETQQAGTALNMMSTQLANMQKNFTYPPQSSSDKPSPPVSGMITQYANDYRDALRAGGWDAPVDTQKCLQGTPDVQANCMQALSNAIQTSLTGQISETSRENLGSAAFALTNNSTPITTFAKVFEPGNQKYAYLKEQMNCMGLDRCVTQLQDKLTSIEKSYQSRMTEKQTFISNANTELKKQAENLGNGFKQSTVALNQKISALKAAMLSAGFKMKKGRDRDRKKSEGLKPGTRMGMDGKEEQGLYPTEELAEHVLSTAGAPDLLSSLDELDEGISSDSKYVKNAEEMEKVAKQNLAIIDSLEGKCESLANQKKFQRRYDAENKCQEYAINACKGDDPYSKLASTFAAISGMEAKQKESANKALTQLLAQTQGAQNGVTDCQKSKEFECMARFENSEKILDGSMGGSSNKEEKQARGIRN